MSSKATALLGICTAAVVAMYFKWRRPRTSASSCASRPFEIDDDAAADIIKRARPALERARQLYAT